jgi:hypothetical protein
MSGRRPSTLTTSTRPTTAPGRVVGAAAGAGESAPALAGLVVTAFVSTSSAARSQAGREGASHAQQARTGINKLPQIERNRIPENVGHDRLGRFSAALAPR